MLSGALPCNPVPCNPVPCNLHPETCTALFWQLGYLLYIPIHTNNRFHRARYPRQMTKTAFTPGDYLRSYAAIAVFFIILLLATPVILMMLIFSLGKLSNFILERMAPLMVQPVFWISGITFSKQLHAEQITSPAVFIINHSSTLDMLTLLALGLPRVRFVAKWQFQYNPIFLLLGRLTGQIFIRRKDSEKAITQLQKTCGRVKRQRLSIMMAPEGSRSHPGVIGPFKKGPFRLAMDLDYPIVPIYFEGNRELSKGGTLVAKPGDLTAHIHPPIDLSDWDLANLEEKGGDVRSRYLQWAGADHP